MKSAALCQRLCSLGVPKEQRNLIIADIQRWVRCSGAEWTVERLKSLKLEFITNLAGKPVKAPNVRHNRDGFPSGVWSWIFRTTRLSEEAKLNVLMAYSSLVSPHLTEKQRKKFFGSMESCDTTGLDTQLKWIPEVTLDRIDDLIYSDGSHSEGAGRPFPIDLTSDYTNSPTFSGRSAACNDPVTHFVSWALTYPARDAVRRFPMAFNGQVPLNLLSEVNPRLNDVTSLLSATVWQCAGKIAAIQEPGYKLRGIASPFAIWQSVLRPLARTVLRDLRERFPSDCTHDQERGVLRVQQWLSEGKVCFSVDMSDATNLMPLHLQLDLLHRRYKFQSEVDSQRFSQLVDLFGDLARRPWFFREEDGTISLHRFTRGQPLGLIPSFAVFALTHNVLLIGICEQHHLPKDSFVILGDDIVISDPEVHRIYRATLKNLGCIVSEPKTLQSSSVAEFAGNVILRDRVLHGYKWRGVMDSNFVAIAQHYGIRSLSMMNRQQRRVVKELAPIPEYLGGFGWNPDGLSLQERLSTPLAQALVEAHEVDSKINLVGYTSLESYIRSFEKDWNQLLSDTEQATLLQQCVQLGSSPSWAQYLPATSGLSESVPNFRNHMVSKAKSCHPLYMDRSEVFFCEEQDTHTLFTMYGPLVRQDRKTEFSPSRKSAYDLVEATQKMEASGVEEKVWRPLRQSLNRVLRRRQKKIPSPPSWRRQETSKTSIKRR